MSATLCVLFNHAYPNNIPIIRKIYEGRFKNIIFIMPFARNVGDDVITSYRGSFSFQGMIADAAPRLSEYKSDYYVFVQDDVLLNPALNEGNIEKFLGIGPKMAFFPQFYSLSGPIHRWFWTTRVVWRLFYSHNSLGGSGAEMALKYLPPKEFAEEKAKRYGISCAPITYDNIENCKVPHFSSSEHTRSLNKSLMDGLFFSAHEKRSIILPYPFVFGISDFFVLHKDVFDEFVHFQGVCAGMDLFAEVAIPSGLMVCAEQVVQCKDLGLEVDWVWGNSRENLDISYLKEKLNENFLLIHPVKLSKMGDSIDKIIEMASAFHQSPK
ncbi:MULTISPECIES: hypothetical protein [Azospirillum]|uniref:DUF5672 domain-containing protein n=1 Tax=Azospirillum brasilense TaxID=192 RepID=A0ABU4PDS9_AZOBR|nr:MULTISPECIES: hypothetical protein [Azospirillum]MDW7555715.1 hypothetical protein [Azospirillum brasilense]MDW7595850.1 hypothetical protein [Azospirillum brasilense]MDW7630855.1 hypothetical protein [Azospirillum brasilense]MDX5955763.1 hypothetical protein [Azospirillum brasilense]TVZ61451.1 hypothetical protein OH82_02129 [Azospirillum brasilense]